MSDRRYYTNGGNGVYQQTQWNGASGYGTYPASSAQYASASYSSSAGGVPPQSPVNYQLAAQHNGTPSAYYQPGHGVYAPVPQRPGMSAPHQQYPPNGLAINVPPPSPEHSRAQQVSSPYSSRSGGYTSASPNSPTMAYSPPPYGHPMSNPQYPASPQRPYACDMCAR